MCEIQLLYEQDDSPFFVGGSRHRTYRRVPAAVERFSRTLLGYGTHTGSSDILQDA